MAKRKSTKGQTTIYKTPGFVNYKKGCTRLAAASDKVYQLLAHGRWLSPASSTTNTGRHDLAEILLKVAVNTMNQINHPLSITHYIWVSTFTSHYVIYQSMISICDLKKKMFWGKANHNLGESRL